MTRLDVKGVTPIDIAPSSNVLESAERRTIATWRDEKGLVDARAPDILGQHLEALVERNEGELTPGPHNTPWYRSRGVAPGCMRTTTGRTALRAG